MLGQPVFKQPMHKFRLKLFFIQFAQITTERTSICISLGPFRLIIVVPDLARKTKKKTLILLNSLPRSRTSLKFYWFVENYPVVFAINFRSFAVMSNRRKIIQVYFKNQSLQPQIKKHTEGNTST